MRQLKNQSSSLACVLKSCRDLPTRDIFSSEHWLLGRSCLDETDEGAGGVSLREVPQGLILGPFSFSSFFFGALVKLILGLFGLGKTCSTAFISKLLMSVYWEKGTYRNVPQRSYIGT